MSCYSTFLMYYHLDRDGHFNSYEDLDEIWDEAGRHYLIFLQSQYNNPNQPEYECVVDYVKHLKSESEPIKLSETNYFVNLKKSIMKTLSILFLFLSNFLYAQEFMGVKVGGNETAFINAFKAKGFTLDAKKHPTVNTMKGVINGQPVDLYVLATPKTHLVWKISIFYPEQASWSSLKYDYNKMLSILTEKYGEPSNKFDFFSSPYYEGDGYEMTAVAIEKCTYASFWDNPMVSLQISKYKQVKISYENKENSALDDKEKGEINNKTY
jgi:hypothetical protein